MKKALILLIISLLLAGCSVQYKDTEQIKQENKIVGTFKNVEVIKKEHTQQGRGKHEYKITIKKGNQKLQLQTFGEESFNALQKGNIIDVGYTKDFFIKEITFPKLEDAK